MGKKNLCKKSISSIILIILVLLFALWIITAYESPLEKWQKLMQNGDYQEAVSLISNSDSKNDKIVIKEITNAIDNIKHDYIAQKLSYTDAIAQLVTLKDMNCEVTSINETIDYIGKLNTSSLVFKKAEQKFNLQEYPAAIDLYKQVEKEDINYAKAMDKIDEALSAYRESIISEADTLQNNHSYSDAITKTKKALLALGEDSILEAYKDNIYYNAITYYEDMASDAQNSQDYLQAIEYLKTADSYDINNENYYDDQINTLFDSYFNIYLAQADAVFQDPPNDYLESAAILKPILNAYPYATSIQEKYTYYMSYQPISLFEQEPFQNSLYWGAPSTGRLDNKGNEYAYMYRCSSLYEIDADWKLAKKYDLLTGTVGVPAGDYDEGVNGIIRIYGDGILLWEKTGIDSETAPETISVDISGVDVLQIYMKGGIGSLKQCTVMVADFKVQKSQR